MTNLPDSVQKILAGKSSTNALRCPYGNARKSSLGQKLLSTSDEDYDVIYTFNHVADADGNNETDSENVTAIKVNMADIVVKKHSDGKIISTLSRWISIMVNLSIAVCPKNAKTSKYSKNSMAFVTSQLMYYITIS